jgi:acyl-CoA reductase-like NAD-dependent aldehyde dehydrogenase
MGTVLQITPWNAPMNTCGWQAAPAIAMGNAVLLKPSELTPFTSLVVGLLIERAGAPKGLVSVLSGYGHTVAQAAIANQAIKKVVFVGSPATGVRIAEAAAKRVLPCVLELGGKSANIVFEDADKRLAALGAQAAIFAACGQSCVAGSRLLVQKSIYDEFVQLVANGANKIKVGAPLDDSTEVGPINNKTQYDHVMKMIESGVEAGAKLAAGSAERSDKGYFVRPTVLSNVTNDMDVARTEICGPSLWPSRSRRKRKPSQSRTTASSVWQALCGRRMLRVRIALRARSMPARSGLTATNPSTSHRRSADTAAVVTVVPAVSKRCTNTRKPRACGSKRRKTRQRRLATSNRR